MKARIVVYVEPKLKKKFMEVCKKKSRSMNNMINMMLEHVVKKEDK